MNEEHIIAEARRRVAEQRQARLERRSGRWLWLLLTILGAVVLAFVLYPVPLPQKLLLAMGGVCGLRPDHSYFAGGLQLPLEARDTGIYGGLSLTIGWLLARGRLNAVRPGGRLTASVLILLFLSMVFDGVNSTLIELGRPHLYVSTNVTRLVTGLLSGIALGAVLVWLLGTAVLPRSAASLPLLIEAPAGLLGPLALCTLFGLLVAAEQGWSYPVIALFTIGGLLLLLAGVVLLIVLQVSGLRGRLVSSQRLFASVVLSCLIAFAVLAVSAVIRWSYS